MRRSSIWLCGADSAVGKALKARLCQDPALKVIATKDEVDISDEAAVLAFAEICSPDIIIDAAGFLDREKCEENLAEAFKINTLGARNLAVAARKHNAYLIHVSTDDIFEGSHLQEAVEFDLPQPLSIYARSRLAAEQRIQALTPKHAVVRSSWVYNKDVPGNFYRKVLKALKNGETFEASVNEISTPTCADSVAEFIEKLVAEPEYGTFHASDEGFCSRYDYARAIARANDLDPELIKAVQNPASNTTLRNLMMEIQGSHTMPEWKEDLQAYAQGGKTK